MPVVIIATQTVVSGSILLTPMPEIIIPVTGGDPQPAIPETPPSHAGVSTQNEGWRFEGDIVRLTLEVDDLGNITPTAEDWWECGHWGSDRNPESYMKLIM